MQKSSDWPSDLLIGLTRKQVDGVPLAITKVDGHGAFIYANHAMCDILGVESVEGLTLRDAFTGEDLATVSRHLASRFASGASDEYEVTITRPRDGVRVPILVSAMPETNAQGEVVGAISIVRDLLAKDVLSKVNESVQDLRDGFAILEAVARQCQRIVPFDAFGVTLYSVDGEHFRQLYVYPAGAFQPSVRWNEMTSYMKALIAEEDVINIPDFEQWLDLPQWRRYRDDADTQQALKLGFLSSLSFPVISGNQVVATVGFGRRRAAGPFSQLEEQRLGSLPLGAAVRMALHYQKVDELKFALALMRRIAAGPASTEFIAATLIDEMSKHYEWENVSILRPDEPSGCLRMVGQKAQKASFLLPEDWHHAIDKGVTGRVYQTRTALNVPDVRAPEVKDLYLAGFAESSSELCLPVIVSGRVFWVLNIEDSKRNAFAKEEQQALEGILREVAVMLELVAQTQLFSELLRCSKDAVIQTDYRGVIVHTNPATKDLLGYSEAEMNGTALATYFKDKEQARRVDEARYVPNDEVHLLHKDGHEVDLLLSGTSLPSEIGLKVYVCNDLKSRKRMETLEILRQMFNEIASQIKTPLSLACTWLAKLHESELPSRVDLIDKTVKQLGKVDLTFDRMLYYERHASIVPVERMVFDIPDVVRNIQLQMPDSEAEQIEISVDPGVPPVRGNIYQVWFCLESLLAYLLRFVPEKGKVRVRVSCHAAGVEVVIAGRAPKVSGGTVTDYAETRWAIGAITELALGEQMIRNFIVTEHGGEFQERRGEDDLSEYIIVLPSALAENSP